MSDDKPIDVTPYRQPMVTSLGIILGFQLNFLANWITEDENGKMLESVSDYAVAGALALSIAMMCGVLFRLLDARRPAERQHADYVAAFRLYMASIVIAFAGLGMALFL